MNTRHRRDRLTRIRDIVFVLASAPVTLPLIALCAVAIRVESGSPVVFRQQRTGHHGRSFQMLKFRTMVHNAEALKEQLQHLNVMPPPDFKIPNDPRITRVGRQLRKTSLDEIPQLWNVLRGEMSLVGPRPTSFSPGHRDYKLWHTRRLDVKPGLTGLWQVDGRNTTNFDERTRLDHRYIRTRSVWRDLVIMARTIPALIKREGS